MGVSRSGPKVRTEPYPTPVVWARERTRRQRRRDFGGGLGVGIVGTSGVGLVQGWVQCPTWGSGSRPSSDTRFPKGTRVFRSHLPQEGESPDPYECPVSKRVFLRRPPHYPWGLSLPRPQVPTPSGGQWPLGRHHKLTTYHPHVEILFKTFYPHEFSPVPLPILELTIVREGGLARGRTLERPR